MCPQLFPNEQLLTLEWLQLMRQAVNAAKPEASTPHKFNRVSNQISSESFIYLQVDFSWCSIEMLLNTFSIVLGITGIEKFFYLKQNKAL